MKKTAKILSLVVFITIIVLVSLPVLANDEGPTTVDELFALIDNIITFMVYALIVVGVIVFIIAGFTFLTAGGDPEKVKKAQNMLLYGVIGIIIGLFAKGLVWVIANIVGIDIGEISW